MLDVLRRWDGQSRQDAPGPLIFAALRKHLVLALVRPGLEGPLLEGLTTATDRGASTLLTRTQARLHQMIAAADASLLPPGGSWDALLTEALSLAVAELSAQLGPDPAQWRWGRVHITAAVHPLSGRFPLLARWLDPPSIPMDGDGDTVLAAGYYAVQDYRARFISVARYIFDGGDWERCGWVVPGGASGHPGSPHYADQLPVYGDTRTVPMRYDRQAIEREAGAVMVLQPRE